jgi:hypothetical protein
MTLSQQNFVFRGNRTLDMYADLTNIVLRSGVENMSTICRALKGSNRSESLVNAARLARPFLDRFCEYAVVEDAHVKSLTGLKDGGMYYTDEQSTPLQVEHVIPITDLVDMYINGECSIRDLFFGPICLVGKNTKQEYLKGQFVVGNADKPRPFTRYVRAGLSNATDIFTWKGEKIDPLTWSWDDHVKKVIEPHLIWNHLYHNVLK